MKVTTFLLFAMFFQVSATVFSQNNGLINLRADNEPLKEILKLIEDQSNNRFLYNSKNINVEQKKSIDCQVESIEDVLDMLFKGTDIKYRSFEKTYVLFSEERDGPIHERGLPASSQQQRSISGKVSDASGLPLPGVTVVVKGTTQGTITDHGGNYTLSNVADGATILFSFVGMRAQEVAVGGKTTIDIVMEEEAIGIEEVVAVGYGTMKKSDLTGSVASVQNKSVNAFPTTNVLQALSGRAAGVQVLQGTGEPGGSISVRIRGTNSIKGSNEPLYVIDGFPTSGSNPTILNNLDIESVEILKDASATAIYGSRGANGVVLITTKSGNAGKTNVHFESNFGIQSLRKKMDMMNAREYLEFYNMAWENAGLAPLFTQEEINSAGEGFDWQDFVFQKALIQNHSVSVNGGNKKTQFSISGSIFNEDGIIVNSGYKRYSVRTNVAHNISDKFKISSNITLSKLYKQNQSSSGGGRGTSLIASALNCFPTVTPWNEDGTWRNTKLVYNHAPEIPNPALELYEKKSEDRSNKVLASASFEYKPIPDLTIRIMGGIENSDDRSDYYRTNNYIGASAYASVSTSQFTSLLNENTISYSKTVGKHNFSGLVGFTYQNFLSTSLSGSGTGFLSDVQESYDLSAASVPGIPDSGYSLSVILSGLGRINYNYDDRYLATINFRTDGSSKYSEGSKWGYFPSGSVAWRLSNEDFLSDAEFLSDLKLRAGWGRTGSQAIGAYATLNNLSAGKTVLGGQYHTSFAPGTNLPGDLKWETTEQTNLGVDAGFFNNRLYLTADYYMKKTRDLLNTVQLPLSGGFLTTIDNVGEISNKGIELAVNANILSGSVKWVVDANISFNRSRVDKLYKGEDILGSSINVTVINDYFNIIREGEPFAVFYGYLDDGYDENGLIGNYVDLYEDGVINDMDKTIIGDPNPDFIYGLNSTLSFKNFDFTVFIQGSKGNDIFNLAGVNSTLDVHFGGNMPKEVLYDHWSPENPNAKYPIPSRYNSIQVSDRFIEDGSYLRFRNIQLAYNIPCFKWGISTIKNVQVYIGGKNLITLTKYSRWDPEVNSMGGSNSMNQGIDYNTFPVNKSVNFGIRADF